VFHAATGVTLTWRQAFRVLVTRCAAYTRAAILLVMCAVTATCGDLVSNPNTVTVILPAGADLLAIIEGVDDVAGRVGPTLSGASAERLRVALRSISSALKAADAPAADRALTEARASYDAYQQSGNALPGEAPDLGVIDLHVAAGIQRPCASNSAQSATPASVAAFSASNSCGSR
jgi:hypothetical protein